MADTTPGSPTGGGTHKEAESHPWQIEIPDHPGRTDSPEYVHSRQVMNQIADGIAGLPYGPSPYQDHHGGGLWLKDDDGWFIVRNFAGIEWSAQFCADPRKVDALRLNAKRLYTAFPKAAEELDIGKLLDTAITDADGVARWTDSICNASVPLPAPLHTGILPLGSGVHHYPTPITDILLIKYDDFVLFVTDAEGQPAAVVPTSPRGKGDARVRVLFETPGTELAKQHTLARRVREPLILPPDHPLARQAFVKQQG